MERNVFVCIVFGGIGLWQLIKRKNLFKVDTDLIYLGIYYVMVIFGYLFFEMCPINYRPILIEGILEASYPSSTTLLVLSVMPTLVLQANRRIENGYLKRIIYVFTIVFSVFMVIGILDIFSFLLIVLPLYPRHIGNYVSAVSLFGYSETTVFNRNVYWGIFTALMILGVIKNEKTLCFYIFHYFAQNVKRRV